MPDRFRQFMTRPETILAEGTASVGGFLLQARAKEIIADPNHAPTVLHLLEALPTEALRIIQAAGDVALIGGGMGLGISVAYLLSSKRS